MSGLNYRSSDSLSENWSEEVDSLKRTIIFFRFAFRDLLEDNSDIPELVSSAELEADIDVSDDPSVSEDSPDSEQAYCHLFRVPLEFESAEMWRDPFETAERLALPTSDCGVTGSNSAGGKILPELKRRFIAHSLSCSPFHRLEMTEILLKGCKSLTHPSFWNWKFPGPFKFSFRHARNNLWFCNYLFG